MDQSIKIKALPTALMVLVLAILAYDTIRAIEVEDRKKLFRINPTLINK
jgi:hypothetical protein